MGNNDTFLAHYLYFYALEIGHFAHGVVLAKLLYLSTTYCCIFFLDTIVLSSTVSTDPSPAVREESHVQMQSLAKPKIYSENSFIVDEQLAEDECLCEVCCDLIDSTTNLNDIGEAMTCRHKVCLRCWKLHLTAKLQQENLTQVLTEPIFTKVLLV